MAAEHRINLRLNDEDYQKLKEKAGALPLARYCREQALDQKMKRKAPAKNRYTDLDPALLRELNRIGVNLNQIARLGNYARKKNSLELWQLIEGLRVIKADIEELIEAVRANNAG